MAVMKIDLYSSPSPKALFINNTKLFKYHIDTLSTEKLFDLINTLI